MSAPALRQCTRHPERAASGFCADCKRSFCKECLTPHAGRLACAGCLARAAEPAGTAAPVPRAWPAWLGALLGLAFLWTVFTAGAASLARLPSRVHPGSPEEAP